MKNKVLLTAFASILLLTGCVSATSKSSEKEMMNEKVMETSDPMKKDDAMKSDNMTKDDTMKKDEMSKDDAMKKDGEMMKDETMMNQGEMATDFTLMDVNGQSHTLSDYKGKKVYVEFWASWCSICLSTLPSIDELSQMKDDDFVVLTIVTPGENGEKNTEDFKKWFEGVEYKNLTVLLDEDGTVTETFKVRAHPTSLFIGSDGVLVKTQPGYVSKDDILNTLKEIK